MTMVNSGLKGLNDKAWSQFTGLKAKCGKTSELRQQKKVILALLHSNISRYT